MQEALVITKPYPEWFEEMWEAFNAMKTRSLGSKRKAEIEANKLKVTAEDVPYLIKCFKNHTDAIRMVNDTRKLADHKDIERWLKYREFEDWEEPQVISYGQRTNEGIPVHLQAFYRKYPHLLPQ